MRISIALRTLQVHDETPAFARVHERQIGGAGAVLGQDDFGRHGCRQVDVRDVQLEAHAVVEAVRQVGDNAGHGDIATFVRAETRRSARCRQSALPSTTRAISMRGKLYRIAQTMMPYTE